MTSKPILKAYEVQPEETCKVSLESIMCDYLYSQVEIDF